MRPAPLALAIVLALLAGCFGGDEVADARRFNAVGGQVSPGWAYDGAGLVAGSAALDGQLSDGANAGIANVTFEFAGSQWIATFDTFAQGEGRDFQDGGIEFELLEHGDTGVADASIPRILAKVAAWGSARVMRDGQLETPEPWTAHLMLSADSVRGPDGRIAKADGTTPYDPAAPADARRIEGDPQALFFMRHPMGEDFTRAPATAFANLSCESPQCSVSAELGSPEGARSFAGNITFQPDGELPLAAGRSALVVITDANGTELARATSDVVAGPTPTTVPFTGEMPAGVVGPLTATLTGEGIFGATVELTLTYADQPFLVVTWDEYTLEDVQG